MSPLPATLRDRRHIATAVTIGLIVQAAAIGAVGFAAAGDPGEEVPDRLSVPRPRVGDRGVYTVTVVRETDGGVSVIEPETTMLEFRWLDDGVARDLDGDGHLVNRVQQIDHTEEEWIYSNESATFVTGPERRLVGLQAGSRRPIVRERPLDLVSDRKDESPLRGNRTHRSIRNGTRVKYVDRPAAWYDYPMCGLRNPLQGRNVSTDDPLQAFGPCQEIAEGAYGDNATSPGIDLRGEHYRYTAIGTDTVAGFDTVVLRREGPLGLERVWVWYSEDVPYPLKIVYQHPRQPQIHDVIRLTSFSRGDEPIAGEDTGPDLGAASPIEMGPRQVYGPDESGVDHPFPLSAAWKRAQDNATVQDYLDAHPDAYLEFASYKERHVDDRTSFERRVTYRWWMRATDGDSAITIWSTKETRHDRHPAADLLPGAEKEVTYRVEVDEDAFGFDPEEAPSPDRLPDRMPTVRSVMDRWSAYASERMSEKPASAWEFRIDCYRDCQEYGPLIEIEAGHDRVEEVQRHDPAGTGSGRDRHRNVSLLGVNGSGRTVHLRESVTTGSYRSQDPDPAGSDGVTVSAARVRVPLWAFPVEHAGAIGLVALVTGVLYWAWPALKQVGLGGLYTRITRDDVLDHPLRQELMQAIRDRPGIHRAALTRAVDLGNGTARHHLRKLVEADLVTEQESQGHVCYFPRGELDPSVRQALPALTAPTAREILDVLRDRPGLSNKELAEATGRAPSTVHHHVQRLRDAGLVEGRQDGRAVRLEATELAERVADRVAS